MIQAIKEHDARMVIAAVCIVGILCVTLGMTIGFTGSIKGFLAALAAVALLVAIVTHPESTLPIILFVWGFARGFLESSGIMLGSIFGQELTLSRVLGVLLTFGIATHLFLRQPWAQLLRDPVVVVYGIFSVWIVTNGFVLGASATESIVFMIRYFSGIAILVIYYVSLSDTKGFRKSAKWVAASGFVIGLLTISQYLLYRWAPELANRLFAWGTVVAVGPQAVERAVGSTGGPFVTSIMLLTPLTLALYLWQTAKGRRQMALSGIVVLTISLAIFATVTRTAMLAVLFLLGGWFLFHWQQRLRRATTLRLALLGIIVGVLLIGPGSIEGRVSDLVFTAESSLTFNGFASGRLLIWQSILSAFARLSAFGWLFGGGLGFSFQTTGLVLWMPQQPHNEYLWLLTDLGFIGLGLYATFAVGVWQRIRGWLRNHRESLLLWEGVFAFQLLFLVYHLLVANFWNFTGNVSGTWFYLAFLGSVLGITQKRDR